MNLIVCYLMGNSELFVDMTLKSVYDFVDKIIIIYDTSSKDNTLNKIKEWENKGNKIMRIDREYEHDFNIKNANSNARNFYLDYLKKNYLNDFCIVLDADEVPDDSIIHLKEYIESLDKSKSYLISLRMIHFIGDLGHEDATQEEHYVLNRLFNIKLELFYPDGEHPVLMNKIKDQGFALKNFIIYHMAYCREMFYIKDRYLNHLNKSEMHSKDYLKDWYLSHLFGSYPKKQIDPKKFPKVITETFLIDKFLENNNG